MIADSAICHLLHRGAVRAFSLLMGFSLDDDNLEGTLVMKMRQSQRGFDQLPETLTRRVQYWLNKVHC